MDKKAKQKMYLKFRSENSVNLSSKLTDTAVHTPRKLFSAGENSLSENQTENTDEKKVMNSLKQGADKVYNGAENISQRAINATKKSLRKNPYNISTVKPKSVKKTLQKKIIKKNYATEKFKKNGKKVARKATVKTVKGIAKATVKVAKSVIQATTKAIIAIVSNPFVLAAVLIIVAIILLIMLIGGAFAGTAVSTMYLSTEENLIDVNNQYTAIENRIQTQIDNIEEKYVDFDEYNYELDAIAHDSHELAAYLTTLYDDYDYTEVSDVLPNLIQLQYQLIIDETTETRVQDDVEEEVKILNVKLKNYGIYSFAETSLTEDELVRYNVYRTSLGCNPYIFGTGNSTDISEVEFITGTRTGNPMIASFAQFYLGNVHGEPFWSWYGYNSRVEWCACFASWAVHSAGLEEPKFASCSLEGIPYFKTNGKWQDRSFRDIATGDLIFFDWENDGRADHVGVVIGTDGNRVYTVEGNSGDTCRICDYSLTNSTIVGYGLMS